MKKNYLSGLLLLMLILLSVAVIAEEPDLDDEIDDDDLGDDETDESETDEDESDESEDENESPSPRERIREIRARGIERAIEILTNAQDRLAEGNKTAPGLAVALRVLERNLERVEARANEAMSNRTAAKVARDAERLAKKAERLEQRALKKISNETEARIKAKKIRERVRNVAEGELKERIKKAVGKELTAELRAMNQEFKAMVVETLRSGTAEEKRELVDQLKDLVGQRVETAKKIREMRRDKIRELLDEDESVEEIASAA